MDLVTELRKLEGVNTSFDYGVEIVVMTVKETVGDWEDLQKAITDKELQFAELFKWDRVCGKGFRIAKKWVFDYIHFHKIYLEFIKVFRYDKFVYAMISEELITLNAEGMGEIWKTGEMEELKDMLKDAGFKFQFDDEGDVVEFRLLGLVDF